ncbi:tRNA (adenosine(37)-N6)-threonylcarbamoyltransferase complex dimerization subunit type 1 TsaB [Vibrio sp. DW001]|uniref:tRNA (adenosine(37)-N6)-threonylcarbamoyltransferase complex dimerization subunit type 1 TsaB n=1 Tax=Vibrio sp. DW001 TaxID=2912315 RepID=UPI0023B09445|nr:tRNA (adenosine(37)-N6)-threonylcarbamoyltransferase complex dimerization subunit type 1 TsaB [Vibrio sp. DW001]WED27478.1 tRNA (adenosine(37)-N6)-threonylcarbamoyltransferase complex dimerization subunit type 1 TsaB [Vibrio sp. DW001]
MSAKILALDTSTENCSVALVVDGQTYFRSEVSPRGHTTKILPMIDEVLNEAGIRLHDVDALAYGRGPGSFTGVRIGIGIAQGLAFGANLPMIGVSTLAAMAQAIYRVNGTEYAACAIDARMSEVYWGRFCRQENGEWLNVDQECVISPENLIKDVKADDLVWSLAGTGWTAYQQELIALELIGEQSDVLYPEAVDIAFLAQFELEKGNTTNAEEASPVYLRDKVAWKKLPGRE